MNVWNCVGHFRSLGSLSDPKCPTYILSYIIECLLIFSRYFVISLFEDETGMQ